MKVVLFFPSLGFPNDRVTDQGLPLGGLFLNQSQGNRNKRLAEDEREEEK